MVPRWDHISSCGILTSATLAQEFDDVEQMLEKLGPKGLSSLALGDARFCVIDFRHSQAQLKPS